MLRRNIWYSSEEYLRFKPLGFVELIILFSTWLIHSLQIKPPYLKGIYTTEKNWKLCDKAHTHTQNLVKQLSWQISSGFIYQEELVHQFPEEVTGQGRRCKNCELTRAGAASPLGQPASPIWKVFPTPILLERRGGKERVKKWQGEGERRKMDLFQTSVYFPSFSILQCLGCPGVPLGQHLDQQ